MRELLRCAADLVLPQECAGCGAVGHALCVPCTAALHRPARRVRPEPLPEGWLRCWAGGEYAGPAAAVLREYKDGDRRDLAPVLARCLAGALDALLLDDPALARTVAATGVLVVPVPSATRTTRRRGDRPVHALARGAVAGLRPEEARVVDVLRLTRRVADQGGLSGTQRRQNLAGAMTVAPGAAPVRGRTVVVVDDVVTSGSTVVEAARALRTAGAAEIVAATALAPVLRAVSASPYPRTSRTTRLSS